MGWQLIDSAPRNGDRVVLYGKDVGMIIAWWGDVNVADSEYGTIEHNEKFGWLISDGHNDPIWYRGHLHLTHWRRPPIPPELTAAWGCVCGAV